MYSPVFTYRLFTLPRYQKTLIVATLDAGIAVWAAWAAIYLRIGQSHWLYGVQLFAALVPIILVPPTFYLAGLYRTIFRHVGANDLAAITRACVLYGAIYASIFTFVGMPGVPRTIGLIQPVLTFVAMIGVRATVFQLLRPRVQGGHEIANALIYGAGQTGRQLAVALRQDTHVRAIAFLDDDPSLHRRTIEGLKIHAPSDAERLIASQQVSKIFIAVPTASRYRRRQIIEAMGNVGVEIRMLAGLADMARGQVDISDIRPVQIEDLLGREPVKPDSRLINRDVADRVVMVTGGGGSIGSELSRQLLMARPRKLILVESSEFALYAIERELVQTRAAKGLDIEIVPMLALVQDETQMRAAFVRHRPETVYHAAAYKHVPLVEINPLRGDREQQLRHVRHRGAGA